MTLAEKKFHQKSAVVDWMTQTPTTCRGCAAHRGVQPDEEENEFRRTWWPTVRLVSIITIERHPQRYASSTKIEIEVGVSGDHHRTKPCLGIHRDDQPQRYHPEQVMLGASERPARGGT
ncbi:MAG: hypothetical protein R2856_12295 [Caldilineaceae bacterium]